MNKIAVYTRDGIIGSSSYYRIWQYFKKMSNDKVASRAFVPTFLTRAQYNTSPHNFSGMFVRLAYHAFVCLGAMFYFLTDIIFPPDCVVVLRSVTPKAFFFPISLLYSLMLSRTKRVIWDFDDDILYSKEISLKEKCLLEKKANHIIVTHSALISILSKEYAHKAICLCTTDGDFVCEDWNELISRRKQTYKKELRMLWLTSSAGFVDMKKICNILDEAAKKVKALTGKQLVLVVVCNKPLDSKFEVLSVENHIWNRDAAIDYCKTSHIGIMPLMNTKFALGKGAFKIIQYYAAGLPVIASKVGLNKEVVVNNKIGYCLDDDDNQNIWIDSILAMAENEKVWESFSRKARLTWEIKYNYETNLKFWTQIVKK